MTRTLLDVRQLNIRFDHGGNSFPAVRDVSLALHESETLGIAGESGSGKTVAAMGILGLLPGKVARVRAKRLTFCGTDLLGMSHRDLRSIRGEGISTVFQEPARALNPVLRVGDQIVEAIRAHRQVTRGCARARALELLLEVGIADAGRRMDAYPHELSGGLKQRVVIAIALSCDPKILIADEPTTALDVTIQAQVLELLRRLRDERQMAMIFITHDLAVLAEMAGRIGIMYHGRLIEQDTAQRILTNPTHRYTKGLLAARPSLHATSRRLPTIKDYVDQDGDQLGPRQETSADKVQAEGSADISCVEGGERGAGARLVSTPPWRGVGDRQRAVDVAKGTVPLMRIADLKVHFSPSGLFQGKRREVVRAVDGVSLSVNSGETLGLVGESGSGKSTTGRAVLNLLKPTSGSISFAGKDVSNLRGGELKQYRQRVQSVFQDPYGALDSRMSVHSLVTEPMIIHGFGGSRTGRRKRAIEVLGQVGLVSSSLARKPHEFSGGQRQRICIARALACDPQFLVLDECVSALDMSIQAEVLNLLKELRERLGLTYIFIAHDLSVVRFISDNIAVMKDGRIREYGPTEDVCESPADEYTMELLNAVPGWDR